MLSDDFFVVNFGRFKGRRNGEDARKDALPLVLRYTCQQFKKLSFPWCDVFIVFHSGFL